ncbi:hypothetical protein EJ05DRAFT_504261 [Pseudovirgaria hyperparasitica]|uniref:Uncharacterized protein n=1 Tax=Pseudovirgaria hyperparasitica TaxID=470096 RepID=A0A6A6VZA9_9PEZI|nr:uncharacterized protein EJ05DRAFT_504261 [Pseudovirgaria hyperparasitica]KAF2754151.1 hypothetical protein EJ05DRAFT_504261 [Pseudovirgaria hyperparasitica]
MNSTASIPKKRRVGRPSKPLSECKSRLPKTSKTHASVPREEKLNVILYILDNRNWVHDFRPHVRIREGQERVGAWRPPNNLEVSQAFHGRYSPTTIGDWWKKRELLNESRPRSRRLAKGTKLPEKMMSTTERESTGTAPPDTAAVNQEKQAAVSPVPSLSIANRFVVYTAAAMPATMNPS